MVTQLNFGTPARVALPALDQRQQRLYWQILGVLTVVLVYAYWNSLVRVSQVWSGPQYSHGYLIPLFAAALLWVRREPFRQVPGWHRWVGVALIATALGLRLFGAITTIFTFDTISFIPCLIGIFVLVGGLPTLRWAAPAIAFLVFMYPLPRFLEEDLSHELQDKATMCSTFALETLGVDCHREGNMILLGLQEEGMNVADQCSGLRMLTVFTGLAVALALISRDRPWWERLLIVISAVPIALVVNVIRITLTGLLFSLNIDSPLVQKIFHDFPGLIMMPIALGILYLEYQILSRIVIDAPREAARLQFGPGQVPRAEG
jgi:exosortase